MENYSHSAILVPPGGLARNDASAQFDLGQIVHDGKGNFYRYVKATEALAIGQARRILDTYRDIIYPYIVIFRHAAQDAGPWFHR